MPYARRPSKWQTVKTAGKLAYAAGLHKKAAKQVLAPSAALVAAYKALSRMPPSSRPSKVGRVFVGKARRGGAKRVPHVRARARTTNIRPRDRQKKDKSRFPQSLAQTYYLSNISAYTDLETGIDGTLTNPTMLYSTPSLNFTTSSIVVMNVANTEAHWIPRRTQAERVYRTGTQVTGIVGGAPAYGDAGAGTNDSFLWYNNAASTNLVSDKVPMKQNGLAENAVGAYAGGGERYTIPNSILAGCNLNLKVGNPLLQDILVSVKVIRRKDTVTIAPGTFGPTADAGQANINTICNARGWTDPNFYETLYSTTVRLPAIRTGAKMQYKTIRKNIRMQYRRSQYRKQYNAENMANLGTQAKPSYTLSDDNTMYNSVYVVMSGSLTTTDYIADVQAELQGAGTGLPAERTAQVAEYPPLSVGGGGRYTDIPDGCTFKFGGTVSVYHRVEAIRRAIGGRVAEEVETLQTQINDLQDMVKGLTCKSKKDTCKLITSLLPTDSDSDSESARVTPSNHGARKGLESPRKV